MQAKAVWSVGTGGSRCRAPITRRAWRLPRGLAVTTLPVAPTAGVKNADETELQQIASEPDSTHVYNVAEFDLMHTVVESLTRTVCARVEEQDRGIKGR